MKKSILLFIILLLACGRENKEISLKFKANVNNPVLSPGTTGEWDDQFLLTPTIVYHKGVFYLFYMGFNADGKNGIGLATSKDGYHFKKFEKNPLLAPDGSGFDAYGTGSAIVLKMDSTWAMYYNTREVAGYGPGPYIGRATAVSLTGPWLKAKNPVLFSGNKGDWDDGFIGTIAIVKGENGDYMMYYTGGSEFAECDKISVGMATSVDGIVWNKYNDPSTTGHPYSESDPVLMHGTTGEWDELSVWVSTVIKNSEGYEMYYSSSTSRGSREVMCIGYATSLNGIQWLKSPDNPFFSVRNDPFALTIDSATVLVEYPSLVTVKDTVFMYYDYGSIVGSIGLATAPVR